MFSVVVLAVLLAIVVLNLLLLSRVRSHDAFEIRLRDDLARAQQRHSEESRALREEVAPASSGSPARPNNGPNLSAAL